MTEKKDELIEELKAVIDELSISPKTVSQYAGVSEMSVYNWLNGGIRPTGKSRQALLMTIGLLRTGDIVEIPDIELEDIILDKIIYDKLRPALTAKQKARLLEEGDYLTYHSRLRELNAAERERKAGDET